MERESSGYRIKDIEASQRPRERLELQGAGALKKLSYWPSCCGWGKRGQCGPDWTKDVVSIWWIIGIAPGFFRRTLPGGRRGAGKGAQIKAAIERGRRLSTLSPEERPTIASPDDVADRVQYAMMALEQEELWVLLLDSRNRLINTEHLSRFSQCVNRAPRRGLQSRYPANAGGLIDVHNHPSGDPSPSPEDIRLTPEPD